MDEVSSLIVQLPVPTRMEGQDIVELELRSEKHGPFYHIFSFRINSGPRHCACLAIGEERSRVLERDFWNLKRLKDINPNAIPTPFVFERSYIKNRPVAVAVLEWMEGYYELHYNRSTGRLSAELWTGTENKVLDQKDCFLFHKQVSKILASLFHMETTQRVSAWSHITGDFLLSLDGRSNQRVRLCTIRSYKPYSQLPHGDLGRLYGVLLFLLENSLINRLDREKGVGPLLWLGKDVLNAHLEGFIEGIKVRSIVKDIFQLLKIMEIEEICTLTDAAFIEMDLDPIATDFIYNHLFEHSRDLKETVLDYLKV